MTRPEDNHWSDPEWANLPKGERMFLAAPDADGENERMGREIIRLTKLTGAYAHEVADAIAQYGDKAEEILALKRDLKAANVGGGKAQEEAVIADVDAYVRSHAGGVSGDEARGNGTTLDARIQEDRCGAFTLSAEVGDSMRRYEVRCYLLEGHEGAHRGWHADVGGELSWDVPEGDDRA